MIVVSESESLILNRFILNTMHCGRKIATIICIQGEQIFNYYLTTLFVIRYLFVFRCEKSGLHKLQLWENSLTALINFGKTFSHE